ncbi:MAG TPA: hypothetical protein DD671_13055, partial [Balneolaceae bacterium]|nr:hypothetical protein [Balneolaceae bacterium]
MAKKTLNEATIRRFQKLANVAPLSEVYHKRDDYMNEQEEEEGGEDLAPAPTEDDPEGADAEMGDMDMDAEEGEMDGDLELTDE